MIKIKNIYIFIIAIAITFSCNKNNRNEFKTNKISVLNQENFLKTALNSFDMHAYFISLDILYNKKINHIVIENNKLYLSIGFNSHEKYINAIEPLIRNNKPLLITDKYIYDKLLKYHSNKKIDCYNQMDSINKNKFFKKYFDKYHIIKKNLSDEELFSIIDCLFKNNILTYTDDETGYLIYNNKFIIK